jgi:hypothetical protein
MIKFFRKIRQKTLTENKFGKYLTYAIGEIILVVIGILIALQINNWNQQRALKNESNQVLYNLQNEIKKSENEMHKATQYIKNIVDKRRNYLNNTKVNIPDSMKIKEISNMVFFYTERIKIPIVESELGPSKKIIQWSELTESIQNLSESIDYYNKGLEFIENDMHTNVLPYLVKQGLIIDIMANFGMLNSVNYSNADIYDSQEFRNVIASSTLMTNILVEGAQKILDDDEKLLQVIEKRNN